MVKLGLKIKGGLLLGLVMSTLSVIVTIIVFCALQFSFFIVGVSLLYFKTLIIASIFHSMLGFIGGFISYSSSKEEYN